jgi:hypothetical protein
MGDSDRDALAAAALGVAGLTILPFLASIPAVYLGRRAKRAAQAAGTSTSLATVGLLLGWVGVILGVLAALVLALVVVGAISALD